MSVPQLPLCSLSAELVAPAAAVLPSAPPAPPADDLSEYARQQWEALLLHVVDGSSPPPALPPGLQAEAERGVDVPALLAGAGLVVKCEGAFTHSECLGGSGRQLFRGRLRTDWCSRLSSSQLH